MHIMAYMRIFSSGQDNFIEMRTGFWLYWYSCDKSFYTAALLKLAVETAFCIKRYNIRKLNVLINTALLLILFFLGILLANIRLVFTSVC